jgi:hypothetical protein
MKHFQYSDLGAANLVVDAVYEADVFARNSVASEPLGPLTGTGNQGGFRFSGPTARPNLVVLYTTLEEPNWPDSIDEENGLFVYFGDHRKPGFELHDQRSGRGGNEILRHTFERAHAGEDGRATVSPFLIFSREKGRNVTFRGLAAPGAAHLDQSSDLVAVWKTIDRHRFQNYRAVFTILDVAVVPRLWLQELQKGETLGPNSPDVWRHWVKSGRARALRAEKISRVRKPAQQLGPTANEREIAEAVYSHFKEFPHLFEHFAADIVRLMDPNVVSLDVTRASRDGGRDGVGRYRIGLSQNCVTVDFAMEAKCYEPGAGLGVKVVSRLISRLRHRQFGILVTTTYLGDQAYQEIVDDQHPIIVCAGGDVARLLIGNLGLHSQAEVREWLPKTYPLPAGAEATEDAKS